MDFFETLENAVENKGSSLCVGLDPWFEPEKRAALGPDACFEAALGANLRIIEATAPYTACYKPNLAFYEAFGPRGHELLSRTIAAIPPRTPWIADAKRGDIDSTAAAYAQAIFGGLGADAVTLSPYMGRDGAEAFLAWEGRGLFLLCKTSNPGASAFQGLDVGGEPLYVRVARECASWSPRVGLVVAGNDPEALRAVRAAAPKAWFLAPGIGAQGGKADLAMAAGARADGRGVLVMAARSVSGAADPGAAARALRDQIAQAQASFGRVFPGFGADAACDAPVTKADPSDSLKKALAKGLVDTGCFRLGDFVLKSGKRSPFYLDLRRLISDPAILRLAARAYARLASGLSFDRLAGIPAAGLPLVTAAGLEIPAPMIWPRMPAKEHGTGNRIEGCFKKGEKALLLDDLITTGASKLEALDILRSEGLVVEDLVVLVERGRQGRADMEAAGIRLHAFFQAGEIFDALGQIGVIDAATRKNLDAYLESEA